MTRRPAGFDFFAAGELPAPALPVDEVAGIVRERWGLDVVLDALGSQQDQNFLARDSAGAPVGVVKITNPAFTSIEVDAQDHAASRIAAAAPDLRIATTTRDGEGTPRAVVADTSEGPLAMRLLEYLPGGTLTGSAHLSPAAIARMGELTGHASLALAGFDHPGLDRVLQWDLRHADRVVELLARHHPDPSKRALVTDAAARAWADVQAVAADLPIQAVHLDLTDDNVVCTTEHGIRRPDGMIDFGDVTSSWAVSELAITISSVLHHAGAEPASVLPAVRAFHALRPLSPAEVHALWPLVVLRGAVLVVSGEHQVQIDAGANAYAAAGVEREWRIFERAVSVPSAVMTAVIADALAVDLDAPIGAAAASRLTVTPGIASADAVRLDVSITSDDVDAGAWLDPGLEERLALAALDAGAPAAWLERGTPRLSASRLHSAASAVTVPTGIDVWFAQAQQVATVGGEARLVVEGADGALILDGAVPARTRARLRLEDDDGPRIPHLVRPEYAAGWLRLTADPAVALGLGDAGPASALANTGGNAAADAARLVARRDRAFAEVQEHYYDAPPRIERGWREHLVGTDGRVYLDMVNNVTPLGHGHPGLAAAVAKQLRTLNTNSRFNYGAVVEFSERLAALAPDPLDTVFLVNSGSEATDLAIRIAMAATGRRDVVSLLEAYHGWTYASDAVSTSTADNPNALATRPDWVHALDAPNPFRGIHRGDEAARYAPEAAARIRELAASDRPPAAFIAETFYGNAGGIPLPAGYLAEVYAAVREAGGLAIADEVQAGYGRLGRWFWGFEQQGVVPDVIAVAKAAGNGYPLGAVITTREIAARYRTQGYFFSSTGGSPASSVAGLAVLDAFRDERLQRNAADTGAYLKGRLEALAQRHPLIGAVHGLGLYLGVEFVRDRATLEPATEETAAICDRLLTLGVIMQPTGDHQNVLKVKPPLVVTRESADFFVDMLDRVLDEGW
ncbi:4-aminobutyrate aminotransferase-like enzyme/Ser/Thr protein kinase RdoA (MazF antagonist) [Agromyces flavus]|uniref:4-aminobutyrate aminotransferase n=1 Tax=Agromyces flavus TaxID=589382 RepID=A0A1H1ZXU7_9MICO|nr:aminotransferase [Agromyces flavus]MCP2367309.1 4-aminobutyrate aminotransferase-like enzyme/Ser/Thr protein kinase RdoA (MazF antagonist) [Agromyces flavus]GGI45985.1 4-aminobutyrate aminotransferase [Agromyces flavus]SDT38066.1 4-aminobutyrate aminotransferase [Agromyces flavus]